MKAICPNCQAAYRVADEKVPETGAQIKCPKCEHTFIVKGGSVSASTPSQTTGQTASLSVPIPRSASTVAGKEKATAQSASSAGGDLFGDLPPGRGAVSTDLSQLRSVAPPTAAGSSTPNLDALSGEAFVSVASQSEVRSAGRVTVRGVSTIRAQSGVSNLLDGFRVRTARGLTYDFPSKQAMMKWLGDRDDLEGYQAAEPGGDWVGVEQLLGDSFVRTSAGVDAEPLVSAPMAPRRASPDKLKTAGPSMPIEVERLKPVVPVLPGAPVRSETGAGGAYSGPVVSRAGAGLWGGIIVAFMVFLAVCSMTLTRYGLVDFSSWLPMDKIGVVFPETKSAAADKTLDDITIDVKKIDRQAMFSRALAAGRRALAAKKFSRAALEFNRACAVHPGSAKALDGLARAFMGLGDVQRAKQVMSKAREITGK